MFYEPESSDALGFGFRCGFLGMLHMEIIQERLEREYDLDLITTAPSVVYEVVLKNQETIYIDNPSALPDPSRIEEIREPIVRANILVPQEHVGAVMTLCQERRGVQVDMQFLGGQVSLVYDLPMGEVVLDLFDRLKSATRGFASLEYGFDRFEAASVQRLDVLINGEPSTPLPSSSISKPRPIRGGISWKRCASSSPDRCTMWRSRLPWGRRLWPARTSKRSGRM